MPVQAPRPTRLAIALLLAACAAPAACDRDARTDTEGVDPSAVADGNLPKPEAGTGSVTGMPRPGSPRDASASIASAPVDPLAPGVEYQASADATEDTTADAAIADAAAEAARAAAAPPAPEGAPLPLPPPPPPAPQAVVVPVKGSVPTQPAKPAPPAPAPSSELPLPPSPDEVPAG